jgi:hypothetical protein
LAPDPGLYFGTGKTPLPSDLESSESAIAEHTIDGDPVDLQNLFELTSGKQVIHDVHRQFCIAIVKFCYTE